jgi:hypothetical protein
MKCSYCNGKGKIKIKKNTNCTAQLKNKYIKCPVCFGLNNGKTK